MFTGSIGSDATPEQARQFLKAWCGDRVYTGPKWWLGEGGVTIYDGKDHSP